MSKKLVGGDYLLDLSSIEIEESEDGETYTNITDADVLEQLTNLKKYVSNPQMAKPVWVKLKNGENDELVVARGTFANIDTGEFEICVQLNGYKLIISIEFTQALNEDNEPIDDWYIDTNDAKYLFTSDAQNIGAISELPVFENIVDEHGNKRFIEGLVFTTDIEGINYTYTKWSLSGTHLMVVLAGNVTENTVITQGQVIGNATTLPEWALDKIVPIFYSEVDRKTVTYWGTDYTSQTASMTINKQTSPNKTLLIVSNAITFNKDRSFRIVFDLLIDNDVPESQGE